MKTKRLLKALLTYGVIGGALGTAAMPVAALTDFYLIAKPVTVALPDGSTANMWGYALDQDLDANGQGDCWQIVDPAGPVNNATARALRAAALECTGAAATIPGPKLEVPGGDQNVRINLVNLLPERTSIVVPGQELPWSFHNAGFNFGPVWDNGTVAGVVGPRPDPTSPTLKVRSFVLETIQDGGRRSYVWTNFRDTPFKPGTYIYHSGTSVARQVQMGLYGGISQDYAAASLPPGVTAPTKAQDIFLSAVDPDMVAAISGGTYTSPLNYKPRYFMVNGQFVDVNDPLFTCLDGTATVPLTATVGDAIQLRLYNAAYRDFAPQMLGDHFQKVAQGGHPLPYAEELNTVVMPAMDTKDLVWTPGYAGRYWIQDRRLNLSQNMVAHGGLSACIDVVGAGGADTVGPVTSNVSAVPNPTNGAIVVTITASANDTSTGGSNIASAEYTITDSLGSVVIGPNPMTAQDGAFDSPIEVVTDAPSIATLADGTYTVSVTSTDAAGNTGAAATTTFDKTPQQVDNPPVANAGGPYSGKVGFAFTLDGSASTDDNGIVSYEWDVDNDGIFDINTPNPTVSHTYQAAYTGTVVLRVTDTAGQTSTATTTADFAVNQVPIANPDGPYSFNTLSGTLDGTLSSDPDGDSLTYSWNFGDGTTGTGATPTHSWPTDGIYTVTLVVNDGFVDSAPQQTTVTIATGVGGADNLTCKKAVYKVEKDQLELEVLTDDTTGSRVMTLDMDDNGDGTVDRTNVLTIPAVGPSTYKGKFRPFANPDPGTLGPSIAIINSDLGGQCTRVIKVN